MIKQGKYEFKEDYKHLEVDEAKWFKMTKLQRDKHMKKVSTTVLESLEVDTTEERPSSLSVSAEQCHSGDSKVPFASIQGIWRKAEELLVDSNSIAPAPGFDEEAGAKMVRSRSGKRPHLVKCGKGGRVSCDSDCPNWKSLGICSHCVVVAETNNCLPDFVDFYRKPSIYRPLRS